MRKKTTNNSFTGWVLLLSPDYAKICNLSDIKYVWDSGYEWVYSDRRQTICGLWYGTFALVIVGIMTLVRLVGLREHRRNCFYKSVSWNYLINYRIHIVNKLYAESFLGLICFPLSWWLFVENASIFTFISVSFPFINIKCFPVTMRPSPNWPASF